MMCKAAIDLLAKGWFQTKKMILWLFHMACLICLFAVVEIAQCLTFLRILTSSLLNFVLFYLFISFTDICEWITQYFNLFFVSQYNVGVLTFDDVCQLPFVLCNISILPLFSLPFQCHHHQKSISKNNLLSPNLVAIISSFWDSLPKELVSSSSTYFFLFRLNPCTS